MKKLLWGLLFLILSCTNSAWALAEKTTVRVGISNSAFSTWEHSLASFVVTGNTTVSDMTGNDKKSLDEESTIIAAFVDGEFTITINGKAEIKKAKGPIVIVSSDKIGVNNLKRKGTPAYYRGIIELKPVKQDKFNIVNVLDMQSYLKGVVPNEMPVSFGLEALKAQAVAARNYASRPNNAYLNYDVCDSTACQVYYGANGETRVSNEAVDATLGIYALYNDEIILTQYSSTSGGITEDYFNTFGNFAEDKPYLRSVADTLDVKNMKEDEYFKSAPPSFDMKSPRYRWQKTVDRFELEYILSKTLEEQSKKGNVEPEFKKGDEFYGLEEIKVLKRGSSKKALEVEIKAVSGNYIVKKELPVRRVFKLNGQILPSANFIVEKAEAVGKQEEADAPIFQNEENKKIYRTKLGKKLPEAFTFFGAGFGHGVGLSQYGAGYLSNHGVQFEEILKHYYKGIRLGTVPKIVSYNNVNLNYTQDFYFSKTKKMALESPSKTPLKRELEALLNTTQRRCFLIIENGDRVQNVEFYINDFHFNPDFSMHGKRLLRTDITQYLKEGVNRITFKPLLEDEKKKHVRFYVVLGEIQNE